jgi:plasmid replication initiation protein
VSQKNVKRGRSVVWIEFDLKRNPDFRNEVIDNADQYDIFGGSTKIRDIPEPPEEYLEWRERIGGK